MRGRGEEERIVSIRLTMPLLLFVSIISSLNHSKWRMSSSPLKENMSEELLEELLVSEREEGYGR